MESLRLATMYNVLKIGIIIDDGKCEFLQRIIENMVAKRKAIIFLVLSSVFFLKQKNLATIHKLHSCRYQTI